MKHLFLPLLLAAGNAAALSLEPIQFESAAGKTVAAERGTLEVPVHHDEPDGETMQLSFVRFPSISEEPGPPIVYLAGGPGGSGIATAQGRRFPLFMAMRRFGDVIAFDQRGTGDSRQPRCQADAPFPTNEPFTRERFLEYAKAVARRCEAWWQEQGVDLDAFDTWESAGDLEVLRRELGAEELTLWGISYGTHLAMAAVKRMGDDRIHRMILASAEGLDQTVKLPARWDAYLERLAARVAEDPAASKAFPDLVGTLRGVLDRLEAEPVSVTIQPEGTERSVTLRLGTPAVRYMLAIMGKNPESAARIPALVYGLATGHYHAMAEPIYQYVFASPASHDAMSLAMDIASGISDERLKLVEQQAETALMGDILNYPMPHFRGLLDIPVLGDEFRAPVSSAVPALLLTGTLDGRTFPEAHAEVLAQFSNGYQVVIENAGHDLFMVSPEVTAAIEAFMRDETPPAKITVDPPEFFVPGRP